MFLGFFAVFTTQVDTTNKYIKDPFGGGEDFDLRKLPLSFYLGLWAFNGW